MAFFNRDGLDGLHILTWFWSYILDKKHFVSMVIKRQMAIFTIVTLIADKEFVVLFWEGHFFVALYDIAYIALIQKK